MHASRYIYMIAFVLAINPGVASALARAPFPDSHSLQPPPQNVHANISHNISGTADPLQPDVPAASNLPEQEPVPPPVSADSNTANPNAAPDPFLSILTKIIYGSLCIIILALFYLIVRDTDET